MSTITPVHYKIHLEPDLHAFLFSGWVEILLAVSAPAKTVCLNLVELAVWRCALINNGTPVECPFYVDPKKEEITLSLPKVQQGRFILRIEYMGRISDALGGFYRSRYRSGGQQKFMALTQFQESDARRAIPCLDHPRMKATFDLTLVIDEHLNAISNCPVTEEKNLPHGKKEVTFQQTPKMSTYLLFFSVGEFEFAEDKGPVTLRAATMPGQLCHAGFGRAFGRKALNFCEDYYDIPFPLPKLDLIAISDFAFGAMENWGAITFRENLFLHHHDVTSKSAEERICNVIAHEITHQWFGNLVTPSDWKYLWLNESFATYFGYGIVNFFYPDWEMGDRFLESETRTALERDALHETFPIELPGGDHLAINASTAPIIYNKGGSVLGQIEDYMGDGDFQKGLRYYLKKYAYDCTASHHFWEALEEVSHQPIMRVMKSWVEQPGFPLVMVREEAHELVLTQTRFTYLPYTGKQKWAIPLAVSFFPEKGTPEKKKGLFEGAEMRIPVPAKTMAYKVNTDQSGFFRVQYKSEKNLSTLGTLIQNKTLSPRDRWGVQSDLYALVKCGDIKIDDYLTFLKYYQNEDAYLPLSCIAGNIFHAFLVAEGHRRSQIALCGKSILENVLHHMGYEPRQAEKTTQSVLRDRILAQAVVYGSREALDFGMEKFDNMMRDKPVSPDIVKSVMRIGAMKGDADILDWFIKRFEYSEVEHERVNILSALGHFGDSSLIGKIRRYILRKVPQRNQFVPVVSMCANIAVLDTVWDWFESELAAFEAFHSMLFERVVAALIPMAGLGKEGTVKAFFENEIIQKQKAEDVIRMALEQLAINVRLRQLFGMSL